MALQWLFQSFFSLLVPWKAALSMMDVTTASESLLCKAAGITCCEVAHVESCRGHPAPWHACSSSVTRMEDGHGTNSNMELSQPTV